MNVQAQAENPDPEHPATISAEWRSHMQCSDCLTEWRNETLNHDDILTQYTVSK